MITASGWLSWLQELPIDTRLALPNGTRFLGVHASPGCDGGSGISPHMNAAEMAFVLKNCDADIVCVGHTHYPFEHTVGSVHVINPGAISLSVAKDKSANYALLDAQETEYSMRRYRVPYDRAEVIDQLTKMRHPGREYLIKHFVG